MIFAAVDPMPQIAQLTLYNHIFPGRIRPPFHFGFRNQKTDITNLDMIFASHKIAQPKHEDEFRVVLIGDSQVYGLGLPAKDTLAAQLNTDALRSPDGRRIIFYSLGYPGQSLKKDLLLIEKSMQYEPDMILWFITLGSFPAHLGFAQSIVNNNSNALQRIAADHQLSTIGYDQKLSKQNFFDRTILGRRIELSSWLQLQANGIVWWATGKDTNLDSGKLTTAPVKLQHQKYLRWSPPTIPESGLDFALLDAGMNIVDNSPSTHVVLINEPIDIAEDGHAGMRYNNHYPRWAYDEYRVRMSRLATSHSWMYLDLWDSIPKRFFQEGMHLSPQGIQIEKQLITKFLSSNTIAR
ncbi:MAG: hypothetical protein NTZ50_15645 [Chloroflexi bacterium]|nr:hypothetical protein [Chloroflexota bacterium]